jgi:TPR repeat protein
MITFVVFAILFTGAPNVSAELLFENENVVEIFQSQDFESNLAKAKQGDARSQYLVGAAYLRGLENQKVEMDPDKGVFWLKKSAEQGAGEAYDGLAVVYREGLGVEPDSEKWQEYLCSGSMIPDTNVGGKIATISEVSDDQKTTFLYS